MTIKLLDKYLNYFFVGLIIISQIAIINISISEYGHDLGQKRAFESGLKGDKNTYEKYSKPGAVEEWINDYWIETIILSLIVIGIPLTIALLRLKYPNKVWITLSYYSAFVIFLFFFILCFRPLFWRFF